MWGHNRGSVRNAVGYYNPPDARYQVRGTCIWTDGCMLYQFSGPCDSVDVNNSTDNNSKQQPLIEFTIS